VPVVKAFRTVKAAPKSGMPLQPVHPAGDAAKLVEEFKRRPVDAFIHAPNAFRTLDVCMQAVNEAGMPLRYVRRS